MIVELLRPAGVELARRWLVALLMVDQADREALVAEVERRVAEQYGRGGTDPDEPVPQVHVVHPPVQRPGYVEQVVASYDVRAQASPTARPRATRQPRSRNA